MFEANGNLLRNTENTIIIFIPCDAAHLNSSYLYGDVINVDSTVTFYAVRTGAFNAAECDCIGLYGVAEDTKNSDTHLKRNWVHLEEVNNQLSIKKLKANNAELVTSPHQIIVIYYDYNTFAKSEILLNEASRGSSSKDHFKNLTRRILFRKQMQQSSNFNFLQNETFKVLIKFFLAFLTFLSHNLLPLAKCSNVVDYVINFINGIIWLTTRIQEEKKLSIKMLNFFFSAFLDMVLGIVFLNWLTSQISLDSFPTLFLLAAETVVNSLRDLLQWLTGDPGGLKLNLEFNKMLATFYLFHIDIWWTFLAFLRPVLKSIFYVFLVLGRSGITFQTSIVVDLLALVSFHVYCIYAYAAKLYHVQITALIALWRLFLGRKKNPLRGKVDSCHYTPEQLFIGTVGFTILLFLLPTTLMYYVVFTCIRVLIVGFGGILARIRYIVHTFPLYTTCLWISRSKKINADVHIILNKSSSNFLVLSVQPVPKSWWESVVRCRPDSFTRPTSFNCRQFISNLLSGRLVYPF